MLEGIDGIIDVFVEVFKDSKKFVKSFTIEDAWGGIALVTVLFVLSILL